MFRPRQIQDQKIQIGNHGGLEMPSSGQTEGGYSCVNNVGWGNPYLDLLDLSHIVRTSSLVAGSDVFRDGLSSGSSRRVPTPRHDLGKKECEMTVSMNARCLRCGLHFGLECGCTRVGLIEWGREYEKREAASLVEIRRLVVEEGLEGAVQI